MCVTWGTIDSTIDHGLQEYSPNRELTPEKGVNNS